MKIFQTSQTALMPGFIQQYSKLLPGKFLQFIITISFIAFTGCSQGKEQVNRFSSSSDTIVLVTEKIKGSGMFQPGARQLNFKDTAELSDYPVIFPGNISAIKLDWLHIDIKPFQFENLKSDSSGYMSTFLKENFPKKIDTLNLPSIKDNSICLMSGVRGNDTIFIVDENNNKDFRDDPVRLFNKMEWKTTSGLIKCRYKIYDGSRLAEDSTWINIGILRDEALFFVSHHLESAFSVDGRDYLAGVADGQSHFGFDQPFIALTSENGIKKDTLTGAELLHKGEYLKLKDNYYRFDDISNDGKYITLVKENDFSNKIGTQVGMIAPDFRCRTIDGDSVFLKDYKGKYLMLINVSACWSEISSYKCFKDLTEASKGKFEFIGIDDSPVTLENNIKDLKISRRFVIASDNKMIREAYRPEFCSRTCFLVNPEGRLIDKFEIFDWESKINSHF